MDLPTSRINRAVENIIKEYKASTKTKGTQLVFLDFGMSFAKEGQTPRYNYNLYNDLAVKLEKNGIPAKEIAFIGDANTVKKQQELFEKANKGEVRVLDQPQKWAKA